MWAEFRNVPCPSRNETRTQGAVSQPSEGDTSGVLLAPSRTAQAFLEAAIAGDTVGASSFADPSEVREIPRLRKVFEGHTFEGGQVRISNVYVDGRASLALSNKGIYKRGGVAIFVVYLLKREAHWQVVECSLCVADYAKRLQDSFLSAHPGAQSEPAGTKD